MRAFPGRAESGGSSTAFPARSNAKALTSAGLTPRPVAWALPCYAPGTMRAPSSIRWLAWLMVLAAAPLAQAAPALTPEEQQSLDAALRDRSTPMKVRLEAALLAGRSAGPELVPALLEALGDPEYPVRGAATLSLGQMGDARAADGLLGRLDDPEAFVRDLAGEALQSLVKRGYGRALEEQVRRWDPAIRVKVVGVGGALGPGLGDGLVAEGLADPDPQVRDATRQALSGWKPNEVQHFLLSALSRPSPRERAAAAAELGERHVSLAVPVLAQMLVSADQPAEAVEAARHALRAMVEQVDVGRQVELARHGARDERSQAMAVLAAVRVADAYVVLESALDDADLSVRADAAMGLAVLGDRRATNRLAVLAGRPENAPIEPVLQSALRKLEQPAN